MTMTELGKPTPINGHQIPLTADGGQYGLPHPCPPCLGSGTGDDEGYLGRCRNCSGSGELHQPWHPVNHDNCNWVNKTPDETHDSKRVIDLTIPAAILAGAIAFAILALIAAATTRLFLWILGVGA